VLPTPAADALIIFYSGELVLEELARETLRKVVPDYMVPARIIRLPRIPRTIHGKVDRTALCELARKATSEGGMSDLRE
jgi:acyl-coenzyme A synthetase/AMP-(fatty) acid ligase